jgi:outer membrane receptor for ferrienterochelin and colicin
MKNTLKFLLSAGAVLAVLLFPQILLPQERLQGTVVEKNEKGSFSPLVGANIYWLGTKVGASTDTSGNFSLPLVQTTNLLVASYVGYTTDTITVTTQRNIQIVLRSVHTTSEAVVTGERQSTYISYLETKNTVVMSEKELTKAACCNLSESFETNPSIDVSFTDAITGTKQIEMLGLAGIYTQITTENLPSIRGLTSNIGLTYLPGPWIESIQVSKGVGSVANGYESITGQINVELRKPLNADKKMIYFNLFGNQEGRFEGNLHYRQSINERWGTLTLLHMSSQKSIVDENHDGYLDIPRFTMLNGLHRWAYFTDSGLEGHFGVKYLIDVKNGGDRLFNSSTDRRTPTRFGFETDASRIEIFAKNGFVFKGNGYKSIGLQLSAIRQKNSSYFGKRDYSGTENTLYANLIFQSAFDSTVHKFRLGASLMVDGYDEQFQLKSYNRTESVPGTFFEYTFNLNINFSAVLGIRGDYHNLYGFFLTPRLHLRYTPQEDWALRFVVGKGQRTANIFAENSAVFASSRRDSIVSLNSNYAYGFKPEVAWNYGFNVTHYFLYNYREGTITLDVYRTVFDNQVVVNLENPRTIIFENLSGESFSNSVQLEINFKPLEQVDTRIAYRWLDVQSTYNGVRKEKPFTAKHRAFINLAYATEKTDENTQWLFDYTLQWFGPKRLPSTVDNPIGLQVRTYSPNFVLMNTQVTRVFNKYIELYLGIENLTDFHQTHPILDSANPFGQYFDSSFIWGPLQGRVVYAGLRWRV